MTGAINTQKIMKDQRRRSSYYLSFNRVVSCCIDVSNSVVAVELFDASPFGELLVSTVAYFLLLA